MSRQVSRGSAGDYEADEKAGVSMLSWRISGRGRPAHLKSIRQMSRQVSRGSAGECGEYCHFMSHHSTPDTYITDVFLMNFGEGFVNQQELYCKSRKAMSETTDLKNTS